ncbi:hypothetical protein TCDM_10379 [Trypanosoma cruzi Dm28c]|uniref:Uncharacterized protein n=1 Tax=Trypanosoma cruzi Dm28c TaxID=1416333 RepID=V5B7K9_TRYCR|nr:hypothetical protein TCDM_10379 [Trypanosoma cruzi Dm28c]
MGVSRPISAFTTCMVKRAPASAMESVALPRPAFAFTTSVPATCTRLRISFRVDSSGRGPGICEYRGTIVISLCPPTTGTYGTTSGCRALLIKRVARSPSSRLTPSSLFLLYTPIFLSVWAAMGTMLFTGFVTIQKQALGDTEAHVKTRSMTMPAFTLNRSSRVIPGLRGTPATMTKTSTPSASSVSAGSRGTGGSFPAAYFTVIPARSMWDRSAATPGAPATSYSDRVLPNGSSRRSSRERDWPMPPAAPITATFTMIANI